MSDLRAETEPSPLVNLDPDFYRQRIPASERTDGVNDRDLDIIVSTLPKLVLAQSDAAAAQEIVHLVKGDCDLQVDALTLKLIGTLRIPSGRIALRCRALEVPKEGAAIDASAAELPRALKEAFRPPAVNWYPGIVFARYSGVEVSKALREHAPLPPGLTALADSFGATGVGPGMAGSAGGSIEVAAETVHMKGDLLLKADGGNGAGGCNGTSIPGVTSESMVLAVPAASRPDAAPGGRGGSGGNIRVVSARSDGAGQWKTSCRGGAGGAPAMGGTISFWDGHGGISAQGSNARAGVPGATGAVERMDNAPVAVAERPWDALFLRKAIQYAQRAYLMDPPTAHPDGSTRFPTSWNELGKLLVWLEGLLRRFEDAPDSAGIDELRKAALYRVVASLLRRHAQSQTYFGDDANAVPMLTLEGLKNEFSLAWRRRAELEKRVRAAAAFYQAGRADGAAREILIADLRASVQAHEQALDDIWRHLAALEQASRNAAARLEEKTAALEVALAHFADAVATAFDGCHLDRLLEGAVMCLFVGSGGPGAVAGMAGLQLAKMGTESWTSLTDDQGHAVNKSLVISEVQAVQGDLLAAGRKELFEGEPPRLRPEGTRLLTSIGVLEDQIKKLVMQLPDDANAALIALDAYKEALIEHGRTLMLYTNAVARLVEETHTLQVARQQLDRARKPDAYLTPEWIDMAVFTGELYHRQVIALLELDDRIRRKAMYLTLDAGAMVSADRASDALWLRGAGDREGSSSEGMMERFNAQVARITEYRQSRASDIFPVPASNRHRSLLVAVIGPGPLLDGFMANGRLSFTAVQAGLEGKAADRIVVADADLYCDARVTHVQPRVFGATTDASRSGQTEALLNIEIRSGTASTIVDARNTPHVFQHPVRVAELTHLVRTDPASSTQSDIQRGGDGQIKGEYHDAIGMFGRWSLIVPETQTGANRGRCLKQVSAVHVYFRVEASQSSRLFTRGRDPAV